MNSFNKLKNLLIIGLMIIGLSSTPGCLFQSSDKGWYTPTISADLASINLSSIADSLEEHNISYEFDTTEGIKYYQMSLYISLPENTTYFFSNTSYNISASSVGFHNDTYGMSGSIWLTISLDYNKHPEYRYPSEKEALEASYLLVPSLKLMKYFLNESSNPMPYNVRYRVY